MPRYILGAGAQGRVVADILRSCGQVAEGFLDDNPDLCGTSIAGLPVVGGTSWFLESNSSEVSEVIVALGEPPLRLDLTERIAGVGHTIINAIHRNAVIAPSVNMGLGTCVCAAAVINPDASVGNAVIVNTGATVDHDTVVEDGAHLSPGVHLAGRVCVGRLAFLSTGVSVAPRVRIGAGSLVGAGAAVVNDIPDGVLALGVPARVIRVLSKPIDWGRLL